MKKGRLILSFMIASMLFSIVFVVLVQSATLTATPLCDQSNPVIEISWSELEGATDYFGERCKGAGCIHTVSSTSLWGNNLQEGEAIRAGGIIRYRDVLGRSDSGTLYRYKVTPKGSTALSIAEATAPSCCVSDQGQACGSCAGIVNCDGTCSIPDPPNFGQECGSCGGTIKCDGKCSILDPPNLGKECNCAPCGCGGTIICSGACSASTPACPTPDQLKYSMDSKDCGKPFGGKTIECIYNPPGSGRKPTISCFTGDRRISCQDTGYGRNHGCDTVGESSCYAWESTNNQGAEACKITCEKKEGCYDKNGNFATAGTLAKEDFGSYYPWGGAAQTDPDQSSQACGCLLVKDWSDAGKCCGDDTEDCAKITSGLLCNIGATFSSAAWVKSSETKGDIKYVGCADAEYLSDGTSWTKCDGTFLRLSVEGNEYICIGKGKETLVECCGDGDCNSDETDGKRLTTGKSIIK